MKIHRYQELGEGNDRGEASDNLKTDAKEAKIGTEVSPVSSSHFCGGWNRYLCSKELEMNKTEGCLQWEALKEVGVSDIF